MENTRTIYNRDPVISAYNNKITELATLAPIKGFINGELAMNDEFKEAIKYVTDERDSYIKNNYPQLV